MRLCSFALLLGLAASPVCAQTEGAVAPTPVSPTPVSPAPVSIAASDQPVVAPKEVAPPAPLWQAEISGGYATRDAGPSGAFAVAGLNRRFGRMYARGAITTYRSIVGQSDTALPSTYVVGSLGTGGNFRNWVFDVWASYGWQHYGEINTPSGVRSSTARRGSPYVSAGFDVGRILPLGKGLYLTPTLGGTFAHDRLLRPSPDTGHWPDYESKEKTFTGIAAARLDKVFGRERQHSIGLTGSWHVTNNGLSELVPPFASASGDFETRHTPDGWGEIGINASLRLTTRLRLEAGATRSFQALAGNSTMGSAGLRIAF